MSPIQEKSNHVVWHGATVQRKDRQQKYRHANAILWFTGLSGAGKSTLANAVEARLHQLGCATYVLDGDNVRHGLCSDLGFSAADRSENIRRVGEVAKLMIDAGLITLAAFISPFREDREKVRGMVSESEFVEIFCHAELDVCESRDTKGLYKKARAGGIPEFTGISSPYEIPVQPELQIDTGRLSLGDCVEQVLDYLKSKGYLKE